MSAPIPVNYLSIGSFNTQYGSDEKEKHIAALEDALRRIRGITDQRIAALQAQNRQLQIALSESLKLQAHYAELINMHDGGERRLFKDSDEWIARLIETGTLAATEPKEKA